MSALVKVPHGTICSGGTGEVHRHALPRRSLPQCAGSSATIKRSSSSGPTRRRQLWILPDRTRRCSRTVLAALVVHLMPALNATRRAALPPSDVPPHAGSPFASCRKRRRRLPHNRTTQRHPPLLTLRRPYRALPHALPSAAQVGRAVSAVEEEEVGVRGQGTERRLAASTCFLHCVSARLSPRW